ncbi:anti-sigma factor family protein [Actinacidiphila acidipaludis]|uniref:Zinc-finger domain-containing protein n=1 Tax=Actinacidiphila acidipaludis TaxID=2873382 RepID=A0ABS7Q8G1_9ACTN|nr:zf-HC2 domain-containing protein [Streptomyces acidipaludis]MBY8879121.1 hypothetical protein [Streptomyces acidipaludis]
MTTGMDPHPEVSEISDLSEGLLPPDRSAEVQAHIADCDLCRDVLRSLEEIRGMLGTLPGPPRMPADVAGRIDAALAAEALLDSTRPPVPRGTSTGSTARPTPVPRETSTAPGGHPGGTSGPGRAGRSGDRSAGSRRRRGFLAVAMAAATALLGGVIWAATSGSGGTSNSAGLDTAQQKTAGANADAVRQQVHDLLAAPNTTYAAQSPGSTDRGNTPMLHQDTNGASAQPKASPVAVPPCVLKATHRTQTPLAAGRELFRGAQSYLVVLPHPHDASRVDAFVVNASCTPSSPGAVLFQGTYPR